MKRGVKTRTTLEKGEVIVREALGSKVEARSPKQWLVKRALTVGTWYLTNQRLIFEGKKPNPFFTFIWQKLEPETFRLNDLINIEIVPWMKLEEALKATFKERDVLIRITWQTREKLVNFKEDIEKAKEKLLRNLE